MLLHTQVTSVCHLDQKIHFDEKKVSNFHSLTKFLKDYFKAHFERMILKPFWSLKTFFQRILKNFLLVVWRIRDHFSFGTRVGQHDSILNFLIWKPESENRSNFGSVAHPVSHHSVALQKLKRYAKPVMRIRCGSEIWLISMNNAPNVIIQNENVLSDPDSKWEIISDFSYDQQKNF